MATQRQACCSSPAAMCYWFAVALIAWGDIALIGMYWRPLRASSAATIFLAMAIGCLTNWLSYNRNRTFHCVIAGPLFLIVGFLLLLSELNSIQVNREWLWPTSSLVLASRTCWNGDRRSTLRRVDFPSALQFFLFTIAQCQKPGRIRILKLLRT
jgi:hypothetical protein